MVSDLIIYDGFRQSERSLKIETLEPAKSFFANMTTLLSPIIDWQALKCINLMSFDTSLVSLSKY